MKNRIFQTMFAVLSLAIILAACGGGGGGGVILPPAAPIVIGDVQALFAANGTSWNDYVAGGDITNATDIACDAATDTACVHAGEVRMVELTGLASCSGITATDALGAFDWVCDDGSGTARIISNGLASGYGLADLIDFATLEWKENSITASKGGYSLDITNPAVWWNNPVIANTTGGLLGGEGTVYVINTSADLVAYNLMANSVSLVAAPGVIINGPGAGAASYVINTTGMDFVWVEGMVINATGDEAGVYWSTVRFSDIRNLTADYANAGTFMSGIYLAVSSDNNRLTNVSASNNSLYGVLFTGSSGNTLRDVTVSDNSSGGVKLDYSSYNTLSGVTTNNMGTGGSVYLSSSDNNTLSDITVSEVELNYSDNNTLSGVTVSNSTYTGVYIAYSHYNTLSGVTASHNGSGVVLDSSWYNTLSSVTANNNHLSGVVLDSASYSRLSGVTASNNRDGVGLYYSSYNTLSDVTASNNQEGISLGYSDYITFTGLLKVGNNLIANCDLYYGTEPGLVHGTCTLDGTTGTFDYGLGNSSDALLTNSVTVASSFVGKVNADDTSNSSDTDGAATIADLKEVFDWTSFENPYRSWGVDGIAFPDATNREWLGCYLSIYKNQTDCEANSYTWIGDARIWDWSMYASDTVIVNSLSYPGTGDIANTLTHTWGGLPPGTSDDAGCEAIVTGSLWNTDHCETTFLHNSMEILGDSIGNENALCESDEDCLYTPNMGSYQGHGAIINSVPAFSDAGGVITGVTLKEYETNGYLPY